MHPNLTECFVTDEEKERQRQQQIEKNTIYHVYSGWATLPLAGVGLIVTVLYIATVYSAIHKHRVSRKCYVLLLNRAIGDFLASVTAFGCALYIIATKTVNQDVALIADTLFIGSFWTAMVSYVSLSVVKAFAVSRPFHYRRWFRMKRCVRIVVLSWICFAILIAMTLSVTALVKIDVLNEWSGCRYETCLRHMYRVRNAFTVACYVITIVAFVITVIFVVRAQRFFNTFDRKKSVGTSTTPKLHFPLWKLIQNVGSFTIFNLFYVLFCIFLLWNPYKCLWQQNQAFFHRMLGIIRITLLLRLIFDPVLSFFVDKPIRHTFYKITGIRKEQELMDHSSSSQQPSQKKSSVGSGPPTRVTSVMLQKEIDDENINEMPHAKVEPIAVARGSVRFSDDELEETQNTRF